MDDQTGAGNGPYDTSEQVRLLPAVRAVYEAMDPTAEPGAGTGECEKLLLDACERAGVTLGAYDARIVRWLAGGEPETCAVIAALITRAATPAGNSATEWGVRHEGETHVVKFHDESAARRVAKVQRDAGIPAGPVARQVTPWTPAPAQEDGS